MKNRERTEETLRKLMKKHLLSENGWTWNWNNRKTSYGYCDQRNLVVSISQCHVELYNWKETIDCILHEIAHGLDEPTHRPHGPIWKKICIKIGGTGRRCFNFPKGVDVVREKYAPIKYECPNLKCSWTILIYKNTRTHCPYCRRKLKVTFTGNENKY